MKNKKGFTLVECAVSLALIGIMVLAAFSTMVYVAKSQKKYEMYELALNKLDCLLVCYKSGDFESSVRLLTGLPVPEHKVFYYYASGRPSTRLNYTWKIAVSTENNSFYAVIYDKNDKVIYEMPESYIRGS